MDKIDYSKSDDWMKGKSYIHQFIGLVDLKKTDYALDAGCGCGYVAEEIKPNVKDVLQIDYDWAMLSRNAMVHHTSTLRTSILDLWMIKDSFFDVIFCRSVLHRLEDPKKAYIELLRVLKPNGKLVLSVSHVPEEVEDEYKKIMGKKGFRSDLTEKKWRSLISGENGVKIAKEGKIKFKIDLKTWGLLKEHENASETFRKFFSLNNGIIECSHAYFVVEKL